LRKNEFDQGKPIEELVRTGQKSDLVRFLALSRRSKRMFYKVHADYETAYKTTVYEDIKLSITTDTNLLRVLKLMYEGVTVPTLREPSVVADVIADSTSFWKRNEDNLVAAVENIFALKGQDSHPQFVQRLQDRLQERNSSKGTVQIRIGRSYARRTLKRALLMVLPDVIPLVQ
jgi:hypothetical protein